MMIDFTVVFSSNIMAEFAGIRTSSLAPGFIFPTQLAGSDQRLMPAMLLPTGNATAGPVCAIDWMEPVTVTEFEHISPSLNSIRFDGLLLFNGL